MWSVAPLVQSDCWILDEQCPWKKSSDIIDFLYGDNQWKVASETSVLVGCGSVYL